MCSKLKKRLTYYRSFFSNASSSFRK